MRTGKTATVAFSGHRTFKMTRQNGDLFSPRGQDGPEEIAAKLRHVIAGLYAEGFRMFLCGMAEGFDLLAGEAVLALRGDCPGIELVAVIPFAAQAQRFPVTDRERYATVLAAANRTVTVCPCYSADCFHRRNDYLVDNSTALVCYFNGSPGGTAYTVKRALKAGLRVENLW